MCSSLFLCVYLFVWSCYWCDIFITHFCDVYVSFFPYIVIAYLFLFSCFFSNILFVHCMTTFTLFGVDFRRFVAVCAVLKLGFPPHGVSEGFSRTILQPNTNFVQILCSEHFSARTVCGDRTV
jgi:hypothetical protein